MEVLKCQVVLGFWLGVLTTGPVLLVQSFCTLSPLYYPFTLFLIYARTILSHPFRLLLIYARTILSHPVCSCSIPAPSSLFLS
ncbi:hypothetical protein XELAEV_18009468mg [Xenopus laevis]|uniref:Uncharacterized protein n=1 Tax=Xenopus laevis TaxID=8355 RepID=A0A974DSS4_XENLA|nr:hypothetical protein XELAEV_18009468mg [Xenopus laevis]